MSSNKRAYVVLAAATKYIGEEAAQTLLTAIQDIETKYIVIASDALERALNDSRDILNKPPIEGCSEKDHHNAIRAIGHYLLDSIVCENLGIAATVSLLRQEPISSFVEHACQHHEDAKVEQMKHMLRAPIMEDAVMQKASENGVGN